MRIAHLIHLHARRSIVAAALLMASACSLVPCGTFGPCKQPVVDAHLHKPCQTQSSYIHDLTFARLSPDIAMKGSALPLCTQSPQSIIVLEYRLKHQDSMRQVAAPLDLNDTSGEFPELLELLEKIESTPYVLHDVRLYMAQARNNTLDAAPQQVEAQWQRIYRRASRLTVLEEARVELDLVAFFTSNHYRDAAYLTLDNAKHALAKASGDFPDQKSLITELSQKLETLEITLNKEMPFSL